VAKDVIPILDKASTHTGVMRARDVRATLDKRNLDPILISTIANIAEINHTNCIAVAELATNLDKMLDLIQNFSNIAANMKERTDQMKRALGEAAEGEDNGTSVN
jgi:hypothetical protein